MTFIRKIPKLLSCSVLEDGGDDPDDDEIEIANRLGINWGLAALSSSMNLGYADQGLGS
jgi:hypothetical protein